MRGLSILAAAAGVLLLFAASGVSASPHSHHHGKVDAASAADDSGGVCGGTERWAVKVASDPAAASIDADAPRETDIAGMNALKPGEAIDDGDETSRMAIEKTVFRVRGYLGFFKYENGKTGDQDYHLVITDKTGRYTSGGSGSKSTSHSFVAEIPNTDCFSGRYGDDPVSGPFKDRIGKVRACFEQNTADIDGRNIDPVSIPVEVTGIAFFDFDHGQTGRSKVHTESNGRRVVAELHPVLAIAFPDGEPCEEQ